MKAANKTVLAILIIPMVRHVLATSVSNKFAMSSIAGVSYGEVLYQISVRSKLECVSKCTEAKACRSIVFDATTRECTANRWTLDLTGLVCSSLADCSGSTIVFYGNKVFQTTMRLACHSNADCVDPLSECRGNLCLCEPGYSYNEHIYECVASCTTYGTTFQPDDGKVLYGNNQALILDISSDACLSLCISETSFVCKTVEYKPGHCFLQDYTKLDRPDLYMPYSGGYVLYTRDCL